MENPPRLAADSRRRKRAGGRGRRETYPRRGNTILKLVRAEQISGPEISLVTYEIYVHTQGSETERERKRGRQSDSREYMQNGGLERGKGGKKKKSEEKRRGREVEAIDTQSFLNEIGKELFYFRSLALGLFMVNY